MSVLGLGSGSVLGLGLGSVLHRTWLMYLTLALALSKDTAGVPLHNPTLGRHTSVFIFTVFRLENVLSSFLSLRDIVGLSWNT